MLRLVNEQIEIYIRSQPIVPIMVLGESYQGRMLESLNLIVRIAINIPSEMFLNGDICRVIGILEDDRVVVKNLEDERVGIVEKNQILIPLWDDFPF